MSKKTSAIVPHANRPDLLSIVLERFNPSTAEGEDALFTPQDNMTGTTPVIPVIKIDKNGLFMFPGDEPIKQFDGIIMHKHRGRAWWKNANITGSPPDCFSMDGHFCEPGLKYCPIPEEQRKANLEKVGTPWACDTCPKAQWGTAFKSDGSASRGKACRETIRLFVMATDETVASAVPYKLMVSPSSLKAVDEFFTALTGKGVGYRTMLVTFSLRKSTSPDGYQYAQLIMTPHFDRLLSDNDRAAFRKLHGQFSGGFEEKTVGDFVESGQLTPQADNTGKVRTKF